MQPSESPADNREQRLRVREALKTLPVGVLQTTVACPLCGAVTPARGLRGRSLRGVDDAQWQLVFTCPACGLVTTFDTDGLSLERIRAMSGSAWAAELRQFQQTLRVEQPSYVRQATPRQLVGTFLVAFLAWLLLIGNLNLPEVAWGLVVSLVVARLTYRFAAIDLPVWMLQPRRWRALILLVVDFVRQLVIQNVTLSIRVLRPSLPIRPGIVAIPTDLHDEVALTLLGSLMTLTPDTVMLDIDQKRGMLYVHWIDVQTTDPTETQRLLSASLEEKITRWLI
ncbi:MAG: Na+/H+ antiporter subunit E [Anaerolineae bacterium]|nr:Na+/H+ antiporter subunit E [Anaerolineae bacterium]